MPWSTVGFWVLGALLVISAALVVALRNPVRSALALVSHMLVLAVVFLTLSAEFLAVVQVVLYAGAIMVLILFTIMLLNLGAGEGDRARKSVGFFVAVVTAVVLALTMVGGAIWKKGLLTVPAVVNNPRFGGSAHSIGYALYDPELPWLAGFEILSLLLLTAVVGAVVLAKRRL